MTGVSGVLVAIAAAAGLALFYLSQSSHVAATGYQIGGLRAELAELRAEQQQLVFQIGELRSPAVKNRFFEDEGPRTLTVGPAGINAALSQAHSGDTVIIPPG
ncbi:MAG: hypothetical protein ABJC24_00035, partial [Chloroflexota bacterium]